MTTAQANEVQMDRRSDDRREGDRRVADVPIAEDRRQGDRRKVQRRRQIDPTTCERDYTNDEIEFMQALDDYKRSSGRMFPTCSEILEVLRGMGYQRIEGTEIEPAESDLAEATSDWDPNESEPEDCDAL